jgi:hypothetical protein
MLNRSCGVRLRSSLASLLLVFAGLPAWSQEIASAPAAASAPARAASGPPASASAVLQAVGELRDEGHFGKKHPERYLRFKPDDKKAEPKPKDNSSWTWWRNFAEWLNRIGRVGIWTLCAIAAALFIVLLLRMRRQAAVDAPLDIPGAAPQRVRQYDIRPESLPDNVGATAWAQWQSGDLRAALVLLYRGALSRLVHLHGLPIRGSSTEGDCMALARRHLAAGPSDYFARVTRARLIGSYAGRWPESEEVRELCQLFELRLAPPSQAAPNEGAAA